METENTKLCSGSEIFSRNSQKTSVTGAEGVGDETRNVDRRQITRGHWEQSEGLPVCTSVAMVLW